MGYDCGSWFAKILLCIFNFLFFILGTVVLGIGIWLAADKASFINLLKMVENEHIEQFTQPAVIEQLAYILIVCGAVMFFLSFLGYCGAIKESQCLLTTYGIFLILLLVLEITACSLAFAYKQEARAESKKFLQSTITRYYSTDENVDAVTLMWNNLMAKMSCCGVNDFNDFNTSPNWLSGKGNRTIPEACCILTNETLFTPKDPSCTTNPSDSNSFYNKGCYDVFMEWLMHNRTVVIGVGIGVCLIQLFAMFLSFCLCKAVDRYRGMRL